MTDLKLSQRTTASPTAAKAPNANVPTSNLPAAPVEAATALPVDVPLLESEDDPLPSCVDDAVEVAVEVDESEAVLLPDVDEPVLVAEEPLVV